MKAIVDCNSFYAACERLFKPALHGKPVVVLSNNDGCVVSRTDEAKKLGIQMSGAYFMFKDQIEKHGVAVFSSNYHLYGDLSRRVMDTLRILAPSVEVYSVDESFLDLTGIDENKLYDYALFVKHTTELWTGIPVSIGVAPTKVLSKLANRLAKKDKQGTRGVVILQTPEQQREAMMQTQVEDIWGVGRANGKKLRLFNINTAWDLRNLNEGWVRKNLGGVVGVRMWRELHGEACIEMKDPLLEKKMIASTRMFGRAVYTLTELKEAVATYISRAAEKLRRQHSVAHEIQVFVVHAQRVPDKVYSPQSHYAFTRLQVGTALTPVLIKQALPLVEALFCEGNKYLKAGVILSHITPEAALQTNLFESTGSPNDRKLMDAVDNINFGIRSDLLKYGSSGTRRDWKMRQELRSKRFTTKWDELMEVR